ncbi:MAG TPA: Uma2 family endonuclease [Ktedonobacteraceae bacterium]|nr:Uma2 family endonuclease [Ktedonobacteraceae bacterium]
MVAQPNRRWMSVEDYLTLDKNSPGTRYEYIDGYVYLMAGGTPQHGLIMGNIQGELNRQFRQRGSSCRAYPSDVKWQLSETRYLFPDVSVTCEERDRKAKDGLRFPLLVVEVLSPGTEERDRNDKFDCYRACASIQEVVLVRTARQVVEVYRRTVDNKWLLQLYGPEDEVEFVSLEVHIPASIIFEDVEFPTDTPTAES